MRLTILAVLALVLLAACGPGRIYRGDLCRATPSVLGRIQAPDIKEASGMAASRRNDGVLWVHNDSGDTARVFALDRTGALLGTYSLAGAAAVDWEDMAIGPGPDDGVDYLYLADIGDNNAVRSEIDVYRVPEPQVPLTSDIRLGGEISGVDKLVFHYPDHAHDAETLLVDQANGDLVIVTKELTAPPSLVFRAPTSVQPNTPYTLEQVGQIDFKALPSAVSIPDDAPPIPRGVPFLPTGGDVSPNGSFIAIRTYGTVWIWYHAKGSPLWDAFASAPCEAPSTIEPQGEAIAFDPNGRGYTTASEGTNVPLNHFAVHLK
jgi:hypothetical protein